MSEKASNAGFTSARMRTVTISFRTEKAKAQEARGWNRRSKATMDSAHFTAGTASASAGLLRKKRRRRDRTKWFTRRQEKSASHDSISSERTRSTWVMYTGLLVSMQAAFSAARRSAGFSSARLGCRKEATMAA